MESLQMFYNKMWTREATSILIQKYHENECLWMTTSPLYRNKNKRIEALHKLSADVCKYRPKTTPEDIKNKINGIRTQYVSEINKLILAGNKGDVYEPTLWCFEILSFLKPFTQPKQRPPNNWMKNSMPKPFRPTFSIKPNRHIRSPLHIQTTSHFQSLNQQQSSIEEDPKEDSLMIKNEPEDGMEDVEIIEEQDILITDEEISNTYSEEEKPTKEEIEEQSSSYPKPKSPPNFESGIEEASEDQRIRKYPEITLVPKKEIQKRKYEEIQENCIDEKKRKIIEKIEKKDESEDRINIFGKFVMSQMRTITDNVLLIKLEHTMQNAIIEAQLKQIEIDEKKKDNSAKNEHDDRM